MKENRVCLVVIDGWGINDLVTEKPFDAIANSETPLMNAFCPYITGSNHITIKEGTSKELEDGSNVSSVRLQAHGLAVGLPADLMGNSEVGHLNIGAGRIVYQDIVRIEKAITERNLEDQGALPGFFASVRGKASCETPARVHMIGLVSDGGVHSHMNHLFALLDLFEGEENVQIYVHFIADGRDTSPTSGVTFLNTLIEKLSHKYKKSKLATVIGRYYAMDRDQRWERTLLAYDALVLGKANDSVSLNEITPFIESKYSRNETDEFLKPIQVDFTQSSCIEDGDSLLFFNYRSDRMRQLVSCFLPSQKKVYPSAPGCTILRNNLTILTMTQYHSDFSNTCNNVGLLFPPQTMTNVLAEWVSKQTLRQCHIAETEKYAHVTFFFNGGQEEAFPMEDRVLVPSPKVATYDLLPGMSCLEVASQVIASLKKGIPSNLPTEQDSGMNPYSLVICNLAPPDMVGHTGHYEATKEAVKVTDTAIAQIWKVCQSLGVYLVVTSDHGNAEKMVDPATGNIHTAHTTNPVPLIIASPKGKCIIELESGLNMSEQSLPALCDVAPTVLELMGLSIPLEMSGRSLVLKDQKQSMQ